MTVRSEAGLVVFATAEDRRGEKGKGRKKDQADRAKGGGGAHTQSREGKGRREKARPMSAGGHPGPLARGGDRRRGQLGQTT